MKIYQQNAAYPSRVKALVAFLLQEKLQSKQDIKHKLCPDFMGNVPDLWPHLLNALTESGMATEEDALVSLEKKTPSGYPINKKTVAENFPRLFADFALQPNLPNGDENSFATLCAWLLKQDPLSLPSMTPVGKESLIREMETSGVEVASLKLNDASIRDNLFTWCNYLGLSSNLYERTIPDPTTFLRWHWESFQKLAKHGEIGIKDFCSKVAEICPVLDGGTVWEKVREYEPKYSDSEISKSLSLSFVRLESEGYIKCGYLDDAASPSRRYLDHETQIPITSLKFLK
ncbi:MAG: hypothetical protein HN996_02485 [Opitutae bacterium]|nr:hypothetical protein [Opitutae bacterium]MBT7743102.1 hypothetical protein [Opitutae bacterium]